MTWSQIDGEREYWYSEGFEDYMEENTAPLLQAYEWEKIDPKVRWNQEQLPELETFHAQEQSAGIHDEIEQQHQIELVRQFYEEQQQQQKYNKFIQLEQWEHIALLVQELNQN